MVVRGVISDMMEVNEAPGGSLFPVDIHTIGFSQCTRIQHDVCPLSATMALHARSQCIHVQRNTPGVLYQAYTLFVNCLNPVSTAGGGLFLEIEKAE